MEQQGRYKTWTLDYGLDYGLEYGLNYGLNSIMYELTFVSELSRPFHRPVF